MARIVRSKSKPNWMKLLPFSILNLLNSVILIPHLAEKDKDDRADLCYLRGKALDFLPEYTKKAEDFLSKASVLRAKFPEAHDALGHVYWKKRDF